MNCRFCGNFVPEGSDSCPVCGRRPEEDPIGKLLSDNRPGMDNEQNGSKASTELKPKSLVGSIVAVVLCVAAWMFGNSMGVIGDIQSVLGLGNADITPIEPVGYAIIGLVVVGTVVGIIGLITFFARVINNAKYMK